MDYTTVIMLLAVVAAFYFLMIRPQQKKAKEQKEHMESLTEGSRVMTVHGIFGTIMHLGERQVILEIAPGVEMTILKQAVSNQKPEEEFEYEDDSEPGQAADYIAEPSDAELEELIASEKSANQTINEPEPSAELEDSDEATEKDEK